MVAYSFKQSFREPIFSKEKQQTIRNTRKRRTVVGDPLTLLSGPRMRPIRWGSASCVESRLILLDFKRDRVVLDDAIILESDDELNTFAILDGFRPRAALEGALGWSAWEFMTRFWAQTHGTSQFTGDLAVWGETFVPADGQ